MGIKTKIEYLQKNGSTHNFWTGGCEPISEGCRNCFAKRIYERFYGKDFSVPIKSKNFDAPLKWKKPRIILVNDMSDFFHDSINIEWQVDAIYVMMRANRHIFLLLTKRPENLFELYNLGYLPKDCLKNVWIGVSVENQKTADERIPELLKIPHFKKWLSVEPMIDIINIRRVMGYIDWVICGAETGTKGVINPIIFMEWAMFLKEQCSYANVPFFFKQMPERGFIPKDLMVREYPPEIERIVTG